MRNPEEILTSEVDWFYFGSDVVLVRIFDLKFEMRITADGPPPDELTEPNEPEYYICRSRNLFLGEDKNFHVETLVLLYGVEHLKGCGVGPQAIPDSFTWENDSYYEVNLAEDAEPAVVDALLDDIAQGNEHMLKHIAYKEDPNAYIATIKNEILRAKLVPYWEAHKDDWV